MAFVLCNLLAQLSKQTISECMEKTESYRGKVVPQKLRKAAEYIAANYTKRITLSELAAHCNLSKQQMTRYFKQELSTTPMKYITEFKLVRAKELLFNQPELTIKEISDLLGFDNQNYFSKVFRHFFSESPSHYRERTVHYEEIKQNTQK